MSNTIEHAKLEQLLNDSIAKEKKANFRSLGFVLLIFLLTTGWLIYTYSQVAKISRQKNQLIAEKKEIEKQLLVVKSQLENSSRILNTTFSIDEMDVKYLYGDNQCVGKMMSQILEMKRKGISFDWDNNSSNYNSL